MLLVAMVSLYLDNIDMKDVYIQYSSFAGIDMTTAEIKEGAVSYFYM